MLSTAKVLVLASPVVGGVWPLWEIFREALHETETTRSVFVGGLGGSVPVVVLVHLRAALHVSADDDLP